MLSQRINKMVVSTFMGHTGNGLFPYSLSPKHRRLMDLICLKGVTVLTKSITRHPHQGNYIPWNPFTWGCIRKIKGTPTGMINAYGLTNPGVEVVAPKILKSIEWGYDVIPDLYPQFAKGVDVAIQEVLEAIEILDRVLGFYFWALELNFSCPNSEECIWENVGAGLKCTDSVRKKYPSLYLIAKISIIHPVSFAYQLESAGASAIHSGNSVPYDLVFPGTKSPLKQYGGGGVSGDPIFHLTLGRNMAVKQSVNVPIIMGGGISSLQHASKMIYESGADAISICATAARDPNAATDIIMAYA